MRLLSTLFLVATLVLAAACTAAEKGEKQPGKPPAGKEPEKTPKPDEPEKPPKPDGEKDGVPDNKKRGIITDGGADTYDTVLMALAVAAKAKDKDAIWRLLASEVRHDITAEVASFKLAKMNAEEEDKLKFLGKKTTVKDLGAHPVSQFLVDAMGGALDCEWEDPETSMRYKPGPLLEVGEILTVVDNLTRLAVTVEKDGLRANIYVRKPDGKDVHLWFVKEGKRWFFHSPGGAEPPDAVWSKPEFVKPGDVEIKLDTPVDAMRTSLNAIANANFMAMEKCMDAEVRKDKNRMKGYWKAIAAGVPPDQEKVFSPFIGLSWSKIKNLPLEKFTSQARIGKEKLELCKMNFKYLADIELKEISNDGKEAVVELLYKNFDPPHTQLVEFVKKKDGWKITQPGKR